MDRLLSEARVMSLNKNLNDVTTLLLWASDARDPAQKLEHIERAVNILTDVRDALEEVVVADVPEETGVVEE